MRFQESYEQLNEGQKKAVDTIYGPVSVIAGPGTGKTQLLTLRIANILDKVDINPDNILALTFTEAGVIAMRDRLRSFIGSDAYKVGIATFHGFCNDLILEYPEKFQFAKDLQMLEDLEKNKLIGKIYLDGNWQHLYLRHDPEFYVGSTISIVSTLKREGISPDDFRARVQRAIIQLDDDPALHYQKKYKDKQAGDRKPAYRQAHDRLLKQLELAEVYEQYQKRLLENGWYDFDDMIRMVVEKMHTDEHFLALLQEQYQFVMVDEYQDTNGLQNTIAGKLLESQDQPNILVVGDDEQSIYRFQGAIMENILDFHTTYQDRGITTIVLTDNYRSTQTILDASRSMIGHNKQSLEKELGLDKHLRAKNASITKKDGPIQLYLPEETNEQSLFLVDEIKRLEQQGIPKSQMAVIYRKNSNPIELMETFRRSDISFRKQKGENLLHHIETQKLLHTLQLITDFTQDALLWEVLLYDFWNLDIHYLLQVQNDQKKRRGKKFYEALLESEDMGIKIVVGKIVGFQQQAANQTLTEFFETFLLSSGYRDYLLAQEDKLERLNILNSFFNEIKRFAASKPDANIKQFIRYMSELEKYNLAPTTQPLRIQDDAVNLMTAHGAKGLEFDVVFLYDATRKNWEGSRPPGGLSLSVSLFEDNALLTSQHQKELRLEEERRLWYVAMTRAKYRLYITATKNDRDRSTPSQFVSEIDEQYIQEFFPKIDPEKLLTISTAPVIETDWSDATKNELQKRADEYVLSVTALNAWLKSPKTFLEKYLIRQPQAKMPAASYGTIIHRALEVISEHFREHKQLPSKEVWLESISQTTAREILTEKEKKRFIQDATQHVEAYLAAPNNPMEIFSVSEKRFPKSRPVVVEGVGLTGSIDRVEYLSDQEVRVVDFKTGKYKPPTSEFGLDYERQLYFYKLLWDGSSQDRVLREGVLDYVTDLKDGHVRRIGTDFDPEKLSMLRRQIKRFGQSLAELDFPEEPFEINK